VAARAKSIDSLRDKLRRKHYSRPEREVTDLLGLRVITYFARDIDAVAAELGVHLDVSERKSRDVRRELEEDQFGYRSVHLISRLRPTDAKRGGYRALRRRWFEVQIRSILDHAWSEIEHETVYKSGVTFPSEVRRRFKAVAGSLEVLEHAFSDLVGERDNLVERYKQEYEARGGMEELFDASRLMAYLEVCRPDGVGWRAAEKTRAPFKKGLVTAALEALEVTRLSSARRLGMVMNTKRFVRAISNFAAAEGISPESASHVAVVVLAVACVKPSVLQIHFPEMLFSRSVAVTVAALG